MCNVYNQLGVARAADFCFEHLRITSACSKRAARAACLMSHIALMLRLCHKEHGSGHVRSTHALYMLHRMDAAHLYEAEFGRNERLCCPNESYNSKASQYSHLWSQTQAAAE